MKETILIFLFIGCTSVNSNKNINLETPSESNKIIESEHMFVFTKIDNKVDVFINDSLIFSSGLILNSPELEVRVDLTPFIEDGSERLKLQLYNGQEPYTDQLDPSWELRYDLILNGQIADFDHLTEKNNALGMVYQTTYIINEWWIEK